MAEKSKSYRELKEELDTVLLDLEAGDDDIDKAILRYKKGQELIGKLEKYLTQTKAKIDILKPPK